MATHSCRFKSTVIWIEIVVLFLDRLENLPENLFFGSTSVMGGKSGSQWGADETQVEPILKK